jgi:hypothetical protein
MNLNCKCGVILKHIRKFTNLDVRPVLDLSDEDGNVALFPQSLAAYANSFLRPQKHIFSSVHKKKQSNMFVRCV